uniref:Uncharacterized protein n=1 Tax=Amphilophus citrinellus TaxID=61819 RepID=A0A3Q0R0W5_AMPCI
MYTLQGDSVFFFFFLNNPVFLRQLRSRFRSRASLRTFLLESGRDNLDISLFDFTTSKDDVSMPRLNPLHPPFVHKRTVSLETPDVHHHNHQRALIMQRREHCRYHQVWRKPFYGTSSEREEYSKICQAVKEANRGEMCSNKQRIQHSKAMAVYRDENKRLMEQSWRDRALTRSQEALKERELLRLNPINWSGTLK